jgi:ankyrin repeat protein
MTKFDKILTAIARNQVASFKKLVTADIVDAVDEDGYTLLANVVLDEDADTEMARHLIKLGAAINRIGVPDEKWTALALALRDGRTEIAKMLLDSGAKAIAKDSGGNTPLHYALQPPAPNLELIAMLLARGADPRQKNRDGDSPLSMAKWGELPEVLAMLKRVSSPPAPKPANQKLAAAKSRSKGQKSASPRAKVTVERAKRKATTSRREPR